MLHEATKSFLAIKATDKKCEVYLEPDSSAPETWFFILPKFKLQSPGDPIYYNEEIRLVNTRNRKGLDVDGSSIVGARLNTGWKLST
jgi:hypothetical protein